MVVVNVVLYKGSRDLIFAESYEVNQILFSPNRQEALSMLEEALQIVIDNSREGPTQLISEPSGELKEGLTRVIREPKRYKPEIREIGGYGTTLHIYDLTDEDLKAGQRKLKPITQRAWVEARRMGIRNL